MPQLIDISALASCFKEYGPHPLHYLYRLIMPAESSAFNLLGNTVNTMFDAVVSHQEEASDQQLSHILQQAWHDDALLFLTTDDDSLNRRYFQTIGQQYENVRKIVGNDFPKQGIDVTTAWLEPSFFCPELGLSGRMDLLALCPGNAQIVELKSGKMNEWQHQAKQAHRVQTMLYAELLNRCLGIPKEQISCFLLYNVYPLLQQQDFSESFLQSVLDIRQQISNILHDIAIGEGEKYFTRQAIEDMYPGLDSKLWLTHEKPKLLEFVSSIEQAPVAARKWFLSRLQFIMREEELKTLQPAPVTLRELPLQALSCNGSNDNVDGTDTGSRSGIIAITLGLNADDHDFRPGDPVIIYPMHTPQMQAWQSIVLRGSIASIGGEKVTIALRHEERRCHFATLPPQQPFALEHDTINSSISQACRSIYRTLLNGGPQLSQCRLIVGPPGTGKTSVTLRNLAVHLNQDTKQRVLITAFTHRAVDEICETLEAASIPYLRLGTNTDTPEAYHNHLLQHLIDQCPNRNMLRQAICKTRFWVGTTARLQATQQLFELLDFDTIIADEASQLLDFQVIDILQHAQKEVILIGDPKQLPAVTLQPEAQSLFEHLYRQGTPATLLDHQGRMHPDIAQFANEMFYDHQLKPVGLPHQQEQLSAMPRFWFFDVHSMPLGTKSNPKEAVMVARLVKRIAEIYESRHWEWSSKTLGIIVPYRQQIAAIRKELDGLNNSTLINIDTVERYQGSQRDVIIYTTTVSTTEQLAQLSAPIELDGKLIDRKLNVAITRARKHLYIIGNRQLLEHSPVYHELLSRMTDKMTNS